jgi:hypothetical protein
MNVQDPSRQEILAAFHRRRTWTLLALVPFLIGTVLLLKAGDLDFDLGGLSGEELGLCGFALIGVSVVASILVWRCPVCGKGFSRRLSVPLCPQCGTVFSEPEDVPTADPAGARREHLERALASEIKKYRKDSSVFRIRGIRMIFLGLVAAATLPLGLGSMPDSWLTRTFGDHAPLAAALAAGGFMILAGILIVVFQTRSIDARAQRHERELRERMGLPPS